MIDVDGMDEDMVTWMRAIDALPVLSWLSLLAASGTRKARFRVTLRCYAIHHDNSCGHKRRGPVCITHTRTTMLAFRSLEELHKQIVDQHTAPPSGSARTMNAHEPRILVRRDGRSRGTHRRSAGCQRNRRHRRASIRAVIRASEWVAVVARISGFVLLVKYLASNTSGPNSIYIWMHLVCQRLSCGITVSGMQPLHRGSSWNISEWESVTCHGSAHVSIE